MNQQQKSITNSKNRKFCTAKHYFLQKCKRRLFTHIALESNSTVTEHGKRMARGDIVMTKQKKRKAKEACSTIKDGCECEPVDG